MREVDCEQGTQEWIDARCGLATASEFGSILTPKKMELSAQATGYACQLIAERLIGGPDPWREGYQSLDMKRGTHTEGEARKYYELECDLDVRQVGFIVHDNERWGASPDGLVGEDGGLELKCPAPKTQVKYLIDDKLPDEYRAQVHGNLIVSGRSWWSFLSYCQGLPPLLVRVERDEYTTKLEAALNEFNGIFDLLFAKIQSDRDLYREHVIDLRGDQTPDNLKAFAPPPAEFEPSPF